MRHRQLLLWHSCQAEILTGRSFAAVDESEDALEALRGEVASLRRELLELQAGGDEATKD